MARKDAGVTARLAAGSRDELVLDQIRETWGAFYDTGFAGGAYRAHRLAGGPLLTADAPGGLASAIWADWTRRRRAAGLAR